MILFLLGLPEIRKEQQSRKCSNETSELSQRTCQQTALETHYYVMVIFKILQICYTAVKFSSSFSLGLYYYTGITDVLLVCL